MCNFVVFISAAVTHGIIALLKKSIPYGTDMCGTVSSIMSGLVTRSLGRYTFGTT